MIPDKFLLLSQAVFLICFLFSRANLSSSGDGLLSEVESHHHHQPQTREEEHRKVLQIEEERLRREREAQVMRTSRPVSRSASRAGTAVSAAAGGTANTPVRTAHVQV